MPFIKLRVGKRTGRYDLSRDLYVIAVQLLDGHILQCTLSTESTGKDCMDYICQRLELQQNIFFGLRYKCSRMLCRWVELDKPLRKQLEKTSQELRLFFGVMFHTPNANTLTDSVARWYYFLQMRADVLDGRLLVSPEKAISLASYSLQIDFGDHEETKPTVATLRGTPLLPRHMTQSSQIMDDLIKQVLVGYKALRGLSRTQAELLYITEAQQCDGYGEEYFSGRDEDGSDIFVGYCMEGIIVKRLQGPPVKYKWEEIVSIMANRRNFIVNCAELAHAHFQMEDVETAKYAAYVCGLHLQFFRNFCKQEDGKVATSRSTPATSNQGQSYTPFPDRDDQLPQNVLLTPSAVPYSSTMDLQQQKLIAGIQASKYMNGFIDSNVPSNQLYIADGGHQFASSPPVGLQSPFSYSTTSVDRLPASRFEHQQSETYQSDVCDLSLAASPPIASISSPLNPSMSSLGSGAGVLPLPQQRLLPNRFPNRQHDGLQSWMSQQILAASASSLSLNRSPMSAFNGSVPHIHAMGVPSQQPHRQLNHGAPMQASANPAHMRLFNGPGRPLSLDEFNLNEMLRTAFEFQQLRQQQPVSPYRQQQFQHRPFVPANSELSSHAPTPTPFMNGTLPPPIFHAPPPPPTTTVNSLTNASTAHPGMQYLASLEAFLTAQGAPLVPRPPLSPPLHPAIRLGNDQKSDKVATPQDVRPARVPSQSSPRPAPANRPGSAAFQLNEAQIGGNDRNYVSTPDLTSALMSKSQSSPNLITKHEHLQRQRQQQQQQKKPVDTRTFENLSIENLDSPTAVRQARQTWNWADVGALLRGDIDQRSTKERNRNASQVGQNGCASHSATMASTFTGTPQRIIVGATMSSGESDENLDESRKTNHQKDNCASPDASRSTIATSSTSTLPDDLIASGQQAFQRFNPKLFEHQLMQMQREQQMQYRQQVWSEQQLQQSGQLPPEPFRFETYLKRNGEKKETKETSNEHHRSVAVLILKPAEDAEAKERRKSVGECAEDVKDAMGTAAHRHRLLVNDHGGSSSEEALRSPEQTEPDVAFNRQHEESIDGKSTVPPMPRDYNGKYVNIDHDSSVAMKTNGINGTVNCGITTTIVEPEPRLRRLCNNDQENENSAHLVSTAVGANRAFARDGLLKREFELIPRKRVSAGLSTAQRRENQALNRDPQVLPYEDTRVMLRPNKHNPHGYINASHVSIPIGSTTVTYIATQGPLRETVVDFWQMIWESGCRIIVMLNRCVEQSKEQSFPYWPCAANANEHQKLKFGEYHLTLHSCTEARTHAMSTFMLKHTPSGQKRLLYHLQYLDWPEGGVPGSVDSFMSFVDEVSSVKVHVANEMIKNSNASFGFGSASRAASRQNLLDSSNGSGSHSSSGSGSGGIGSNRKRSTSSLALQHLSKGSGGLEVFGNGSSYGQVPLSIPQQPASPSLDSSAIDSQIPPVVVHCNSGAGRTGVYLLTEVMIRALQHNQDLDMARALTLLRQKRMHLVQTYPQYRFVVACIAQYMRQSRLI